MSGKRHPQELLAKNEERLGKPGQYRVSWYGRWEPKPVHSTRGGIRPSCRIGSVSSTLGFDTVEDAVAHGHRPCRFCFPEAKA